MWREHQKVINDLEGLIETLEDKFEELEEQISDIEQTNQDLINEIEMFNKDKEI